MRRKAPTALGLLVVVGLSAAAPAQDTADAADLRERLDELRATLERERSALEAKRSAWERERARLEKRRARIAGEVVAAERAAHRLERRAAELAEQRDAVRGEARELAGARSGVAAAARRAAEQVAIALREVSAAEGLIERLEKARERLKTDPPPVEAVASVFAALGEAQKRAGRITLAEREIYAADGERRTVELLSAGLAAFAYRRRDEAGDPRYALALAAPEAASGYRWEEGLPARVKAGLREAFAAAEGGAPRVKMPMDVTGRITAHSALGRVSLGERLAQGGPIMVPLAAIALLALLLVLERAWVLYGRNSGGGARAILEAARAGRFEDAEARAARVRGAIGATMRACLARRDQSQLAMEDAIQEQLLHEQPRLQRFVGGLGVLAAIAPLLGLLGTVTGIIETFGVIQGTGETEPGLMAGGISEALVTTATGLTIAIPILLLQALLRARIKRILAGAERNAATLLNQLVHGGGERAS